MIGWIPGVGKIAIRLKKVKQAAKGSRAGKKLLAAAESLGDVAKGLGSCFGKGLTGVRNAIKKAREAIEGLLKKGKKKADDVAPPDLR